MSFEIGDRVLLGTIGITGMVKGIVPAFATPDQCYRLLVDVPMGIRSYKLAVKLDEVTKL